MVQCDIVSRLPVVFGCTDQDAAIGAGCLAFADEIRTILGVLDLVASHVPRVEYGIAGSRSGVTAVAADRDSRVVASATADVCRNSGTAADLIATHASGLDAFPEALGDDVTSPVDLDARYPGAVTLLLDR